MKLAVCQEKSAAGDVPGCDRAPAATGVGGCRGRGGSIDLFCYDVEFPEAVRALVLAGAELIAVPTALIRPFDIVARTLVPARAFENQVYAAYAGI